MDNTFHKDLVAALGELPHISFDSQNPYFNASYLSLAGILNAVRPILRKHNLGIIQDIRTDSGSKELCVRTSIIHSSGQKLESSEARFPIPQYTPQGLGSVISYAKRYQLQTMLGIAGQDDDSEAAEAPLRKAKPAAAKPQKTASETDTIDF
jgi:hypothetical protein